ncbi:TPR-like protein [Peniophora sp. CONT]|nr:TPR-like protein [Peniophora sp. CONT]
MLSLLARFARTGEVADLEQAISVYRRAVELAPDDYPDKPLLPDSLGCSFRLRFERTGELEDLEWAISFQRHAAEITPTGHPDELISYYTLGISLIARFERVGELSDLEQAVALYHRVAEITPDGHPNKPILYDSSGRSLFARFKGTAELEDLEQAISFHRRAVERMLDGDPNRPMHFANLAHLLSARFEHSGELEDLEQTISTYRYAVELVSDDQPQKPTWLSRLCHELYHRFEHTGERDDIASAISAGYRAVELSPEGHEDLCSTMYSSLARCLQRRFEHIGDSVDDIQKAISLFEKAIKVIPAGDPRLSSMLADLGGAQEQLFQRTQVQADFDAALESFTQSTLKTTGSPSDRLDSAKRCAFLLSEYPSFSTADLLLSAHARIIAILPEIIWIGHDISRRYKESSQVGELVSAAVSVAIAVVAFTRAMEWLEDGRALVWAQLLSLRIPLDELQRSHPELADAFRSVQQQLQISAHSAFSSESVTGLTVNVAADRHRGLAIEHDKILNKIRSCHGFEDFMRPKTFAYLTPSSEVTSSRIVFINVDKSRCDALLLAPGGEITLVPLSSLTMERAEELRTRWTLHLKEHMVRARGSLDSLCTLQDTNPLQDILERMWTCIVGPVLNALDPANLISNEHLPHIIWCPTGPLTQLPLHAAGIYAYPLGPRAFDLVVSSYTPSLSAFLRCIKGVAKQQTSPTVLVVTQPETPGHFPLPETRTEGLLLKRVLDAARIPSGVYSHDKATVQSIRDAMSRYPWVHLACHGSQNEADAKKSAFELYDSPLTLSDLMGTVADNAELAFLSACQTAVGDEKTPEESAHLAAGMLAAGFKGVVATMWSIGDVDAPVIVEAYYKELLALRSAGTLGKGETGAAYALHEATRVLREKVGENSFMRWVPFVHLGV